MDVQLAVDVLQVSFYRADAEAERLGDILVVTALCGQGEQLEFPIGERVEYC